MPLVMAGLFILGQRQAVLSRHGEALDQAWEVICLGISFIGLAIRAYVIGYAPKRTSGRNTAKQVAETLNTTGAYSLVRHPLYVGNFVIWIGIALFGHLWWLTLVSVLAFWLYYERIMLAEEAYLRKKFGREFEVWADVTPAVIPGGRNWSKPAGSFSLKIVLKREYGSFFSIIVTMFTLKVSGDMLAGRGFELDPMWGALLGLGFATWITLRVLKKKTSLLDVEGR